MEGLLAVFSLFRFQEMAFNDHPDDNLSR